jgi:hypothetical protein
MCAVTAVPYLSHPPPDALRQAWSVAVVLPREWAVTVMTFVAVPVPKPSGSDTPRTVVAGCAVVARGRGALLVTRGRAEVTGAALVERASVEGTSRVVAGRVGGTVRATVVVATATGATDELDPTLGNGA